VKSLFFHNYFISHHSLTIIQCMINKHLACGKNDL